MTFGLDPDWLLGQSDPTEYLVRIAILREALKMRAEENKMKINAIMHAVGASSIL